MICGGSQTCGCSFQSASLDISRDASGLVTLETYGPGIVTSTTRPDTPFLWQHIFETDTGLTWVWNGTDWLVESFTVRPECWLTRSVGLSIPDATATPVDYDVEQYDPFGWHDLGNPTAVTPTIPGIYQVFLGGSWVTGADYLRWQTSARRNGAVSRANDEFSEGAGNVSPIVFAMLDGIECNGTTDFIEHWAYQNNTANTARTITPTMIVRWMGNL